jgi:hypothetical protein
MTRPDFSGWLARPPYGSEAQAKDAAMTAAMNELTEWHATQCAPYRRMLTLLGAGGHAARTLDEVPYLPVRLFKEMDLRSVDAQAVFKTLSSSGTTGQQVSRIHLDRDNAAMQTRVLGRLVGDALGHKRLPMLVIDSPAVLKDRQAFSARGAGILGFSVFGLDRSFALDADMRIDLPAIEAFLQRHAGRPLLVFGFTYMIWAHFLQALRERGLCLPLADGVLLHGGGWKKLAAQAVDAAEFRRVVQQCTGMTRVVNYYGMVEQTGSIAIECEQGRLHVSDFSDLIVRDPVDFHPLGVGQVGLIETLSVLPLSYPGHALLTEDMGRIDGIDDCPCGRRGKTFTITGRLPKAELRGCSDTYERAA